MQSLDGDDSDGDAPREPRIAVVLRVTHGTRSADVLFPLSAPVEDVLRLAASDPRLAVPRRERDIVFPLYVGGVRKLKVVIKSENQAEITMDNLVSFLYARDAVCIATAARSIDEVASPVERIPCELLALPGEAA